MNLTDYVNAIISNIRSALQQESGLDYEARKNYWISLLESNKAILRNFESPESRSQINQIINSPLHAAIDMFILELVNISHSGLWHAKKYIY